MNRIFLKRIFSLAVVALILVSCMAILPASAADSAKTVVSVNKGDEVVYTLYLSDVPQKVVGCDFSVYYDSSALKVKEYADFSGSFNTDDHQAVLNPNLAGELRGNWSILSGVAFKTKRTMVSVKFESLKKADTHVSYYVRYLYPESMEQFTQYTFSCDVTVNKAKVIDNAAPELNVDEVQDNGEFVNTVTGSSKDADVNTSKKSTSTSNGNNGGAANENSVTSKSQTSSSGTSSNSQNNNTSSKTSSASSELSSKVSSGASSGAKSDTSSVADNQTSTQQVTSKATDDTPVESSDSSTSTWVWVLIGALIVALIAGLSMYILRKK